MNQEKIGTFIAQCRKEKGLTQMQLAEKLEITSQAVSKWETGKGMPDVSLLQPLCDILSISLNELFSGEHISEDAYKKKAEENFSNIFREKQNSKFKPVKYVFSICANVTLFVAVIELIIGFAGSLFSPDILKIMVLNSFVWFILFFISFIKYKHDKSNLDSLKQSGVCINAEIANIIPAVWIRIGNYISCKVVYSFLYNEKEYSAKSCYYVLTPFTKKEELQAYAYIDKDNPSKHSLELLKKQ